ncbi:MAG: hypothetical protein J7518_06410 [Nocardioidaceae bacterium]|nr:hypothetical protein [Nocardioidaceae bacterium]
MIASTWRDVIARIDDLSIDAYSCFSGLPVSGLERVLIAHEDDWRDDDDRVPAPAADLGMTDCITKGDLAQILASLSQQDPNAPSDVALRAIAYYLENDAFVTLSADESPDVSDHLSSRSDD